MTTKKKATKGHVCNCTACKTLRKILPGSNGALDDLFTYHPINKWKPELKKMMKNIQRIIG